MNVLQRLHGGEALPLTAMPASASISAVASISMPRCVRIGGGASNEMPAVCRDLGFKRLLIVTDSFVSKSGLMTPMVEALEAAGVAYEIFDGVVPDPTTASLVPALSKLSEVDAVVGFGGGSSIDTAKVLALLARHDGPLRRYKVPAVPPMGLPVIAVPTTAGTGSEVTRVAVVSDSETGEKMLLMGPGLLPTGALVDFELTMGKPYRLTADSGALLHRHGGACSWRAIMAQCACLIPIASGGSSGTLSPSIVEQPSSSSDRSPAISTPACMPHPLLPASPPLHAPTPMPPRVGFSLPCNGGICLQEEQPLHGRPRARLTRFHHTPLAYGM